MMTTDKTRGDTEYLILEIPPKPKQEYRIIIKVV